MRLGMMELILILAVVLILFGPKQLPKLAKMFGKTAKTFQKELHAEEDDTNEEV